MLFFSPKVLIFFLFLHEKMLWRNKKNYLSDTPLKPLSKNYLSDTPLNPCPAEPGYTLHLQTVDPDQLASELDLHCLQLSMTILIM